MAKQTKEQKVKSYLLKFKKNLWSDRIRDFLKENQKDIYWGAADISFCEDNIKSFYISNFFPKEEGKLLDAYKLSIEDAFDDFYEKEGFLSFHIFNPSPYKKKEEWECFLKYLDDSCVGETPHKYLDNNSDWESHYSKYDGECYYYIGKSYERTVNVPLNKIITDKDDSLSYQSLKENHPDWIIA